MARDKIVQIDGGIGRVLCATAAVERLGARLKDEGSGARIVVLTSSPEVFVNNPHVYKTYGLGREHLWDDVIQHGDFSYPEPYYDPLYYTKQRHLIDAFDAILNPEGSSIPLSPVPRVYLSREERAGAQELMNRIKIDGKEVALLQMHGSAYKGAEDGDRTERSLGADVALDLIDKTTSDNRLCYINTSHVPVNHPSVWQQSFNTRQILSLAELVDFVVTIDSATSHIGAAFNKTGVLLLGGTWAENVGYASYRIMTRPGYPRDYLPNRFVSTLRYNEGAMEFGEEEVREIAKVITEREFGCHMV